MRWKSGKIFSIRLRNDTYVLLQMLPRKGQVAVFDQFRKEDVWTDVKLEPTNVLFVCTILRSVHDRSSLSFHEDVEAVDGIEAPTVVIYQGSGFREVTFWKDSKDQRTVLVGGNGRPQLWYRIPKGDTFEERLEPIAESDYDQCNEIEMANLRDYPEFNERLYLCSLRGVNFDPLREIALNRPLEADCIPYFDIISGKVKISEFGY